MINLPENIDIDLRGISNAKSLEDLWKDETEAFIFGFHHPRVQKYINNCNLKIKNPELFYVLRTIKDDTRKYIDEAQNIINESISENIIDTFNKVLTDLSYDEPLDKIKMAYVLGNYARFNIVK